MSHQFTLHRRVNSLQTALLGEKLATLCGFTFPYGAADEWPIYESDDFPQEVVELLRSFKISIEKPSDEEESAQDQELQPQFDEPIEENPEKRYDTAIEDVLGLYISSGELIVMFPKVIDAVAKALKLDSNILYQLILAHELSHAVTHGCVSKKSFRWKSFDLASSESKELLAQLVPFIYFERQGLRDHLAVMEVLSRHQRSKYNAYKTVADSIINGNKEALPNLVAQTRESEYEAAKRSPSFQPDWEVTYQVEGQMAYSIRNTGVVFIAKDEADLLYPSVRNWLPNRISDSMLSNIESKIEMIESSLRVQGHLSAPGRRRPKTSLGFRRDYSEWFIYSANSDDWGAYIPYFDNLVALIEQALNEARQSADSVVSRSLVFHLQAEPSTCFEIDEAGSYFIGSGLCDIWKAVSDKQFKDQFQSFKEAEINLTDFFDEVAEVWEYAEEMISTRLELSLKKNPSLQEDEINPQNKVNLQNLAEFICHTVNCDLFFVGIKS